MDHGPENVEEVVEQITRQEHRQWHYNSEEEREWPTDERSEMPVDLEKKRQPGH